jgi:NADPH:quinone reductase-like Zn-dependent oxidoreductase
VHGDTSVLGTVAIQLANAFRARVITTVRRNATPAAGSAPPAFFVTATKSSSL